MTDPSNWERDKYADEIKRRAAERAHDQSHELTKLLNEAATRDAQGAIRILLAINGGAAAALLAFTGGLVARSTVSVANIAETIANLKWFGLGVVTSALAATMAYLTNFCYAGAATNRQRSWEYPYVHRTAVARRWLYAAYVFHALGVLAAFAGLGLFVYGLYKVHQKVGKVFG